MSETVVREPSIPDSRDRRSARHASYRAPQFARIHLAFLDGLRGLAALYVVVFHLISTQDSIATLPFVIRSALRPLRYGHFAVDLFIVLSGYCIMLPVARAGDGRIPGGAARFFRRRARRILPPMWAALAFTLVMILLVRLAGARARADDGTAFSPANLITHALLIHNWFPRYVGSINLPMWTVAVEWQIYFVFPALLLPIWRRSGALATLAGATAIGLSPHFLFPAPYNLDWFRPWYLGLFTMGMVASAVHFGPAIRNSPARVFPWHRAAGAVAVSVIVIEFLGGEGRSMSHLWAKDLLLGAGFAALLAAMVAASVDTHQHRAAASRLLLKVLESRPLIILGGFSYSMYLTHMPMMWVVKWVVHIFRLSPPAELVVRITVAPMAIAIASFLFYIVFERPFISPSSRINLGLTTADPSRAAASSIPAMPFNATSYTHAGAVLSVTQAKRE